MAKLDGRAAKQAEYTHWKVHTSTDVVSVMLFSTGRAPLTQLLKHSSVCAAAWGGGGEQAVYMHISYVEK